MNSLGKQAVSTGSINQRVVELALLLFCVCFQDKQSVLLKFLFSPFIQNGRVLYSFENKAYLKPCQGEGDWP